MLACRTRELLTSLEGEELQARVRRGRWAALLAQTGDAGPDSSSSLRASVDFLAAKGIYLRDARELFLSRILANLAKRERGWGQVERTEVPAIDAARDAYSSTGPLAAALRATLEPSPSSANASCELWWSGLSDVPWRRLPCKPAGVARAVAEAWDEAKADWHTEQHIFGARPGYPRAAALSLGTCPQIPCLVRLVGYRWGSTR